MGAKLILIIPMIGYWIIVFSADTHAEHTTLKQAIIPIDCVIDTVNTGLSPNLYITPEECREGVPVIPGRPMNNIPAGPNLINKPAANQQYTLSPNSAIDVTATSTASDNLPREFLLGGSGSLAIKLAYASVVTALFSFIAFIGLRFLLSRFF